MHYRLLFAERVSRKEGRYRWVFCEGDDGVLAPRKCAGCRLRIAGEHARVGFGKLKFMIYEGPRVDS